MSWAGRAVAEALAELGPTVVVPEDLSWRAAGVSIDSRTLQAGELFVALSGPRYDGAAFLPQAAEAGAVAAVASAAVSAPALAPAAPPALAPAPASAPVPASAPAQRRSSLPLFEVPDSLEGLAALAPLRPRCEPCAPCGDHRLQRQDDPARAAPARPRRRGCPAPWFTPARRATTTSSASRSHSPACPKRQPSPCLSSAPTTPARIADLAELARPELALLGAIGTAHIGRFAGEDALAAEKAAILCGWEGGGPSLAVVEESALARPQVREALAASGAEAHIYGAGAGAGAGAGTGADTGTSTSASGTAGSAGLAARLLDWAPRRRTRRAFL